MKIGWKWTAFVICGIGLFKDFFPSAPYFIEYAIEHTDFTDEEVNREILPVTIYGHFFSLLVFLLITDLLRYKPVIVLGGISAIACWAITIFCYDSKAKAMVRQVLFSIEHSSEVVYLTFMYEIVNRDYYEEITSLVHGSMHAGKFFAGVLGQILLSYKLLSLDNLNYISFGASICVVLFAVFLPNIDGASWHWHVPNHSKTPSSNISTLDLEKNDEFYNQGKAEEKSNQEEMEIKHQHCPAFCFTFLSSKLFTKLSELGKDITTAYSNAHVVRWSIWYSMSRAIYWQIALFTESLWKQIEEETHHHPLNGAVDAAHALISTLLAAAIPYVKLPWEMWGERYLSVIALIQGLVTLLMSQTASLYISSICYVIVQATFEVVFIFAAIEIAGSLPDHKASFIFGINSLVGILFQAVITNIITTRYSFALDFRQQFFIYGFCSIVLSLIFFGIALLRRHKNYEVRRMENNMTQF